MKTRTSFLLTLFTIFLLLPAELLACACCAEYGHYSLSYAKPDQYLLEQMQKFRFSTAQMYLDAAGDEAVKGLSSIGENYQVSGLLEDKFWKLNFTDDKNKTGMLKLPLPDKMIRYSVDIREGSNDTSAGMPNLYKELRFKYKVKEATGIFDDGIGDKTEFFLVLQGRGNACTFAEDFKNWRLEIMGKNTSYAFFGNLTIEEESQTELN